MRNANKPRPRGRLKFLRSILALTAIGTFVGILTQNSTAQPPELPPGVTLMEEPPGKASIPESISVYSIEVNWTHPLLRSRLEFGLTQGAEVPLKWDKVAPGAFKIQLSEPLLEDDAWKLALDAEQAGPPAMAGQGGTTIVDPPSAAPASMGEDWPDQVRIGGYIGWAVHGAKSMRDMNPPPPTLEATSRVNVRWLGHPADWIASPPDFKFESNWMLSVFDPLTGHGQFHLIVNRSGLPLPPIDLNEWIKAAWPGRQVWIAIHSMGNQVMAGIGDWRLGDDDISRAPTTGRIERTGALLVLDSVKPGELVDWARLDAVSFATSPADPDHPAEDAVRGSVWPTPFRPLVWAASTEGKDIEIGPYFEIALPGPKPIQQVRVVHASGAGWSRHFDPREIRIQFIAKDGPIFAEPVVVSEFPDSDSVVQLVEMRDIAAVRVEFPKPTQMDHPRSPARMAALQLWGPWDGVSGLE